MKEMQGGFIAQWFFKFTNMIDIVLPTGCYYRDEVYRVHLKTRIHCLYHWLEYERDGYSWYFKYLIDILKHGYGAHPDEDSAYSWANTKYADKFKRLETQIMSDDEYIKMLYRKGF